MTNSSSSPDSTLRKTLAGVLLVGMAVALVFGQTGRFDFVDFDDPVLVTANETVQQGLSLEGIRLAFTDTTGNLWHPLTWISHQVDVTLFGDWAGGHHLHNVLLHLAATLLFYLLLVRLTGRVWLGVFAAVLFGIHPLRAESVAWVAERKDVLSAFFWMATCWFYVGWAKERSRKSYAGALICFVAGFLAKPVLMTLPAVLLLIDFWPLGRFAADGSLSRRESLRRIAWPLIREKLPFFGIAALLGGLAFWIESRGGHAGVRELLTPAEGIIGAVLTTKRTLLQTFWPDGLIPFYPYPTGGVDWIGFGLAAAALLAVTALAIGLRKKFPALLFGWGWFLVVLAPMSGLMALGEHFGADRYTYLPHAGLLVAAVWGLAALAAKLRIPVPAQGAAAVVLALFLGWSGFRQVSHWRDAETLWTHTLRVDSDNYFAHGKRAVDFLKRGEEREGVRHLTAALEARPDDSFANANLGRVLRKKNLDFNAVEYFRRAVNSNPHNDAMRLELATTLEKVWLLDEAREHWSHLATHSDNRVKALTGFGTFETRHGRHREALESFEKAATLEPANPVARFNYGSALLRSGRTDDAIESLRAVLSVPAPDSLRARAHFSLGKAFERTGHPEDALVHYRKALILAPTQTEVQHRLHGLLARNAGSNR